MKELLTDLEAITPKINGFFSATTRPVSTVGVTETVYAVAQCWETISQKDCQSCLTIGYNNIQSCPPGSDGSTVDSGCFLRYSDASFFTDNSIINIKPYLRGRGGDYSFLNFKYLNFKKFQKLTKAFPSFLLETTKDQALNWLNFGRPFY